MRGLRALLPREMCTFVHSETRQGRDLKTGVDLAARRLSPRAERGGLASEASFYDRYASLEAMLAAREEAERKEGVGG